MKITLLLTGKTTESFVKEGFLIFEKRIKHAVPFETIIIPDNVTVLSYGLFQNCESLESVVLPDGLKIIGKKAFKDCQSLKHIILPEGITNI